MRWRETVMESDRAAVGALVTATGFFDAAERALSVELVEEALTRGHESGYQFLFADADGTGNYSLTPVLGGYRRRYPASISTGLSFRRMNKAKALVRNS